MKSAVGFIEAIGLTAAVAALDAACKTAEVTLIGIEKVIGAGKAITVTISFAGEVAAVQAGIEAGVEAATKNGRVLTAHVIPRPHEEVEKLIESFRWKKKSDKAAGKIGSVEKITEGTDSENKSGKRP